MKIAVTIFALCLIAAACGKKVASMKVANQMELAILQDDGQIYQNQISEKFDFNESGSVASAQRASDVSRNRYAIQLEQTTDAGSTESGIDVYIYEAGTENAIANVKLRFPGKTLSTMPSIHEECRLEGAAPAGGCRIYSAIVEKNQTDQLGNKRQLFKHLSENYTRGEGAGIRYCEVDYAAQRLEWRDAEIVDATGKPATDRFYRSAYLDSTFVNTRDASYKLQVTCFKDFSKTRGGPDYRSVFRAEFRQNRL